MGNPAGTRVLQKLSRLRVFGSAFLSQHTPHPGLSCVGAATFPVPARYSHLHSSERRVRAHTSTQLVTITLNKQSACKPLADSGCATPRLLYGNHDQEDLAGGCTVPARLYTGCVLTRYAHQPGRISRAVSQLLAVLAQLRHGLTTA